MRRRRLPAPSSRLVTSTPATLFVQKHLSDMTPDEGVMYLEQLKDRLTRKQQRERNYLDRRAARGTRTPTDEAYESDQVLEQELLTLLDDLHQSALHARGG